MRPLYDETILYNLRLQNALVISQYTDLYKELLHEAELLGLGDYTQFYRIESGVTHRIKDRIMWDVYAVKPDVRHGFRALNHACSAILITRWYVPKHTSTIPGTF